MVWVPKPVWDESSSGPQLCNQPSPPNWPRWVTPGSLIWDCSLFSRYLALDYQVSSFSHRPLRHRPCPRGLVSAGDSSCRSHCPSELPQWTWGLWELSTCPAGETVSLYQGRLVYLLDESSASCSQPGSHTVGAEYCVQHFTKLAIYLCRLHSCAVPFWDFWCPSIPPPFSI